MAFFPRALRVSFLPLLLGLGLPAFGQQAGPAQQVAPLAAAPKAQTPPGVDPAPWLFKGSDIPPDPAWSFGTLPNGVRYAVRKNGVPPGQVAVRVRIDAGSLHETDAERGYAHFLEHLTFRGSRHVPDGEAKRVWQRLGATFGSDSNAQTTPTQTLYKLDLPGATPQGLDESLKILAGMVAAPTITDASVNAERPVVLAEQREQPGPQVRISDTIRQTFFAGQPLADRSPIGSVKTLEGATGKSMAAFHGRWYRPDRTVVIISGDMDPSVFAAGVARHFGEWKASGPAPREPDFGKPDPSQPATQTIAEPGLPTLVAMAVVRPWTYRDDTIEFNQRRMVDTLAARVISRRLEQRARAGGSFLQAGVSVDDVYRSGNATSVNIVPVGDDWATALKDVRAVIADAKTTPPTQGEIDRELADYDTALRTQVETARVEAGARQADDIAEALEIREVVAGPETSYGIFKGARAKNMFTPAAILQSTKKIFDGVTRAVVNTRQPDPTAQAKLEQALKADVTGLAGRRAQARNVSFADLPALGAPGRVTSRVREEGLELERVTFSNGTRLLLFTNSGETGRVYVRVRFGGGRNALPVDRQTPAWAGELALVASGIGKLDQNDLESLVAGRRVGFDFDVGDDAFSFNAMTNSADLADQLRLFAAKLAAPGWDAAPVQRARAVAQAASRGYDASPDGVIGRELDGLLRDGDPRWTAPTPEQIERLNAADFRRLWEPLLQQGPIEVSVFGDVAPDAAIDAVAKSFGALKPRSTTPVPAKPVRFPAHVASPVVRTHTGPDNQAAAVIAWPTGGGIEGIAESRRLDVLAQVFSDRLFERLRQAEGASYSPQVQSQWPVGLPSGGRLIAVGQVTPDRVPLFFRMAREIAADLAARPIAKDELDRILRPMGQYILRASSGNQFWMQQLAGAAYDQRRVEATKRVAEDYVTVTPELLQQTAAKYLQPERDWTMAVLPKGAR
ncbi:M16 family metallopeptidase [Sphingomonas lenta]|uniref:Peptidase M16 n=1 Tax=Sphingomonas lenta TaxID=1141887 RepID=A0A2A2SF09_9SPHN|nr:insulinase family protein [Sphingomonas lenta]PAX07793.1 peptidase M16 [Sphingomonas lenta]